MNMSRLLHPCSRSGAALLLAVITGAAATASLLLFGRRSRAPALRAGATVLLAVTLAGCRFDLTPDAFEHAAAVGETVRDTLTLSNPSDEPVDFSLDVNGSGLTVSPASGVLEPGAEVAITVSADCEEPGLVDTEIAVSGWTGKQGATVGVPFALECATPIGAQLMRLEVFQGPPVFLKDYLRGKETKPVNLHRPENGAEPVPEWKPPYWVNDDRVLAYPSRDDAWSADNQGMVTGIWGRRAAVAVTAFHEDASSATELSATVDGEALPELKRETEPFGDGYETVAVFDVSRERYRRGAVLAVALEADGVSATDTLALFGEMVEPLIVTWIPIDLPEFPAPEVDAEAYMEGLAAWLPIAERETSIGPTMAYVERGDEGYRNRVYRLDAAKQLLEHHARHACGPGEIYIGYWDDNRLLNEEGQGASLGIAYGTDGVGVAIGAQVASTRTPPDLHSVRSAYMVNAHEVGHLFYIVHTFEDPARTKVIVDYPYDEPEIGPARGWDPIAEQFVERGGEMEFFEWYSRPVIDLMGLGVLRLLLSDHGALPAVIGGGGRVGRLPAGQGERLRAGTEVDETGCRNGPTQHRSSWCAVGRGARNDHPGRAKRQSALAGAVGRRVYPGSARWWWGRTAPRIPYRVARRPRPRARPRPPNGVVEHAGSVSRRCRDGGAARRRWRGARRDGAKP